MKKMMTDRWNLILQIILWVMLLLVPFLSQVLNGESVQAAGWLAVYNSPATFFFMVVFYANYFVFIPYFLFRRRYGWMLLVNAALTAGLRLLMAVYMYWVDAPIPPSLPLGTRLALELMVALLIIFLFWRPSPCVPSSATGNWSWKLLRPNGNASKAS